MDFVLPPILDKLFFLIEIVRLNKRINILEFGSGWSTIVFSKTLNENKEKYFKHVKSKIRRNDPFKMICVETYKKFSDLTKKTHKKIFSGKINNVKYFVTKAQMTTYNNKICTEYINLPLFSPDLIYLDGPDQRNVGKKINNINTNLTDFFPMSCDVLKIEYFLTPGTILIVDGRAANVQFLKDNFSRNWAYKYVKYCDQHVFVLIEKSLGKYNDNQIKFYNNP